MKLNLFDDLGADDQIFDAPYKIKGDQGFFTPVDDAVEPTPGDQAHFGYGENLVILLMGRRGQGKTALMTALMHNRMNKYRQTGYPGHIFTNYDVKFLRSAPNGQPIDYYAPFIIDTISAFPPWYHDGATFLDEVQTLATSRRSMSRGNVNLSGFMTQIRHRNMECTFTTQFPQVLDYQLLLQVDLFGRVNTTARYKNGFPAQLEVELYDYWGQFTGRDQRKRWPPDRDDMDQSRLINLSPSLIGTYEHHKIIASTSMDPLVRERIIMEEGERQGGYQDWMLAAGKGMDKAIAVNAENPSARYTDLQDMVNRMDRKWEHNLASLVKIAAGLEHGQISTGMDLVNYINNQPGWKAWSPMAPGGQPMYKAVYVGEGNE